MKLDKAIFTKVVSLADLGAYDNDWWALKHYLKDLDLVVKPGDSSQGTLVENNCDQK